MLRRAVTSAVIALALLASPAAADEVAAGDVGRQLQSVLGGLAGKMGKGAPPADLAPAASTAFIRSLAVSKAVEQIFIDGIREIDPAAAGELETALNSNDVWALLGTAMAGEGLSSTDAADCLAVYLLTGWQVANGVAEDPDAAAMKRVSGQMSDVLRATPDWAAASDADKQKMSEGFLLQAMLFDMMGDAAANDPATLTKVRADVREGMKATLQIDPGLLALTGAGLAPK